MLASFPFRFEVARFQVTNLRFFVKDLFLGSEGEMSRRVQAAQDPISHSSMRLWTTKDGNMPMHYANMRDGKDRPLKELSAVRISKINLDGAWPDKLDSGGFDLYELLRIFIQKLSAEVLRKAPILSAFISLVPALLSNHVLWGGQGNDIIPLGRKPVSVPARKPGPQHSGGLGTYVNDSGILSLNSFPAQA